MPPFRIITIAFVNITSHGTYKEDRNAEKNPFHNHSHQMCQSDRQTIHDTALVQVPDLRETSFSLHSECGVLFRYFANKDFRFYVGPFIFDINGLGTDWLRQGKGIGTLHWLVLKTEISSKIINTKSSLCRKL